jgi:uncharacterized protein (DUF433 family)
LSSWSDLGLVSPAVHGRDGWEFDFANLVRGRMIKLIEDEGVHIRSIADRIRALYQLTPDPLLDLVWAVGEKQMFTRFPDEMWTGGGSAGQGVFIDAIDPAVVGVHVRQALRRPESDRGHIVTRRGVCGGKPIFAGSRIPVSAVQAYLRLGRQVSEILSAYPELHELDVEAARRMVDR